MSQNRYQAMGLNEPNMMALDLVDLITGIDADPSDADISPLLAQFAEMIGMNADVSVREFLPMVNLMVKECLRDHCSPMQDVDYRMAANRFLAAVNTVALRYRELL